MVDQDKALAEKCKLLTNQVETAIGWVQRNAESVVRNNTAPLQATLRASARALRRAERAASRKMCVGVFGPSQAGKSYLISALARDEQGNLQTTFEGTTCDFLRDINPEGGKESTGLVTRFTVTPFTAPAGYPVRIRLLSETDVIKIIINTYHSDIKHQEAPEAEAIVAAIDALATKAQPAPTGGISLDDMEELEQYVSQHFRSNVLYPVMKNAFWSRATQLAPLLSNDDRAQLFALIWGGNEHFSQLYRVLRDAVHKLGNAEEAFAPITALMPRKDSIIDVSALTDIALGAGDILEVCSSKGIKASLPRSVITALAAELTIVMDSLPHPLFSHTDLLDFPGYRSRFGVEDFQKSLASETNKVSLDDYFLRGKVAYLFERYRDERELTSMILCIGPSTQEVQDLPRVIDEWVCSTHGATAQARVGKDVALFMVLSKFDMEFQAKGGSGSTAEELQERWRTRIKASLVDFLGKQHDWPKDWNGRPFNNMFCVRNPNVEADFYDHEDGLETVIRSSKQEYIDTLQQAFLATEEVKNHFANPAVSWEAVMKPNDGGVTFLKDSLAPVCNPEIKRKQVSAQVQEEVALLNNALSVYYKSGDHEAELNRKKELAKKLTRSLGAGVIDHMRFGELLRQMQLEVHDCFDLYLQVSSQPLGENAQGNASAVSGGVFGERTRGADIFDELFGDEPDVAEEPQEGLAPSESKDEAQYFSAIIETRWVSALRELAEDKQMQEYYFIPAKEFGEFIHELIQGAARIGVRKSMEEAIRQVSQYRNVSREKLAWKQAELGAEILASYINWLGYQPNKVPAAQRMVDVGGRSRAVFSDAAPFDGLPILPEVETDFSKHYCIDWLAALYGLMVGNVAFAEDSFDLAENSKLGDILKNFQ